MQERPNIDLEPEVEIHLLESLDKSVPNIEIYTKPEEPDGKRIFDSCQTKEGCIGYLLNEEGLALRDKVSEKSIEKLLANYSCLTCQKCNR